MSSSAQLVTSNRAVQSVHNDGLPFLTCVEDQMCIEGDNILLFHDSLPGKMTMGLPTFLYGGTIKASCCCPGNQQCGANRTKPSGTGACETKIITVMHPRSIALRFDAEMIDMLAAKCFEQSEMTRVNKMTWQPDDDRERMLDILKGHVYTNSKTNADTNWLHILNVIKTQNPCIINIAFVTDTLLNNIAGEDSILSLFTLHRSKVVGMISWVNSILKSKIFNKRLQQSNSSLVKRTIREQNTNHDGSSNVAQVTAAGGKDRTSSHSHRNGRAKIPVPIVNGSSQKSNAKPPTEDVHKDGRQSNPTKNQTQTVPVGVASNPADTQPTMSRESVRVMIRRPPMSGPLPAAQQDQPSRPISYAGPPSGAHPTLIDLLHRPHSTVPVLTARQSQRPQAQCAEGNDENRSSVSVGDNAGNKQRLTANSLYELPLVIKPRPSGNEIEAVKPLNSDNDKYMSDSVLLPPILPPKSFRKTMPPLQSGPRQCSVNNEASKRVDGVRTISKDCPPPLHPAIPTLATSVPNIGAQSYRSPADKLKEVEKSSKSRKRKAEAIERPMSNGSQLYLQLPVLSPEKSPESSESPKIQKIDASKNQNSNGKKASNGSSNKTNSIPASNGDLNQTNPAGNQTTNLVRQPVRKTSPPSPPSTTPSASWLLPNKYPSCDANGQVLENHLGSNNALRSSNANNEMNFHPEHGANPLAMHFMFNPQYPSLIHPSAIESHSPPIVSPPLIISQPNSAISNVSQLSLAQQVQASQQQQQQQLAQQQQQQLAQQQQQQQLAQQQQAQMLAVAQSQAMHSQLQESNPGYPLYALQNMHYGHFQGNGYSSANLGNIYDPSGAFRIPPPPVYKRRMGYNP